MVTLRAGTTDFIPQAAELGCADAIEQADPTTVYVLVATVETFFSSGITDAFELFDHIRIGELGNAIGCGLRSQRPSYAMFKQRFLGWQVQKTVLANANAGAGRSPKNTSRPTTTTLAGLVGGEGC
ncbi:hypothetical protein AYO22_11316 [Fonsecaea multimorphosa]|nr:hypothetical protein AYO22_11316 [Fonsecaea multimorphosa]